LETVGSSLNRDSRNKSQGESGNRKGKKNDYLNTAGSPRSRFRSGRVGQLLRPGREVGRACRGNPHERVPLQQGQAREGHPLCVPRDAGD